VLLVPAGGEETPLTAEIAEAGDDQTEVLGQRFPQMRLFFPVSFHGKGFKYIIHIINSMSTPKKPMRKL
jgi:hypothetical protein